MPSEREIMQANLDALSATATVGSGQQWRHKKRGVVYEIVTSTASMQCASAPAFEGLFKDSKWTVYRNVATGGVWIRLTAEFMDGRFERVA